jgi:hypothetical protein
MVKKIFAQQYSKKSKNTYHSKVMAKRKFNLEKARTRKNTKKKTSIGRRPKMSSMNKHKRRSFKAYNSQGK